MTHGWNRIGKENLFMSTKNSSKATETAQATQLIAGFQKHLSGVTSLTLASTAYTPAN